MFVHCTYRHERFSAHAVGVRAARTCALAFGTRAALVVVALAACPLAARDLSLVSILFVFAYLFLSVPVFTHARAHCSLVVTLVVLARAGFVHCCSCSRWS